MRRVISFILLVIFYIPLRIIYPIRVVGRKYIPRKGKIILVSNHQSNVDPIIIWHRIFRRRFKYMAKSSLFKNKFAGFIFSSIGAYPVDRGTTDIKAIKKTLGFLKEEKAVCIFPEGTRLKTAETNELKNGVIIFALKTGSPIVPSFFQKKTKPFTFGRYDIGQPFDLAQEIGYTKGDKITDEIIEVGKKVLQEKMFELKRG